LAGVFDTAAERAALAAQMRAHSISAKGGGVDDVDLPAKKCCGHTHTHTDTHTHTRGAAHVEAVREQTHEDVQVYTYIYIYICIYIYI